MADLTEWAGRNDVSHFMVFDDLLVCVAPQLYNWRLTIGSVKSPDFVDDDY